MEMLKSLGPSIWASFDQKFLQKLSSDGSGNKPCEWGNLSLNPKREVCRCKSKSQNASNLKDQKSLLFIKEPTSNHIF